MRFNGNLGFLLLGIWLILTGLGTLGILSLPSVIMGLLALAAGILILISR